MDVEGPRDVYQWGAITSLGLKSKGKKVLLVLEPVRAGPREKGL